MKTIEIIIDEDKLKKESAETKQDFQNRLFDACSRATTDFDADVDFSDPMHWVITYDEKHEQGIRKLLES